MPDDARCDEHTKRIAKVEIQIDAMQDTIEDVRDNVIEIKSALLGTMNKEGHLSKNTREHGELWLWAKGLSWLSAVIVASLIAVWIRAI